MRKRWSPGNLLDASPSPWLGAAAALLGVAVVTALIHPLREVVPAVSTGVIYLLPVLLVSIVWGRWLGIATSVLSAAAFNWFHIPPTHQFTISDGENWIALATFFVAAIVTSALADLARAQAHEASERRGEAERALESLLAANAERDALEAEAIEARALRRSDELKTALLRSVSHDLRSPLTAIVAAGEALSSPSLSGEDRAALADAVTTEGGRLSRLVDNLLDLSRLESGAAEPRRDWVSMEEVARVAAEQACPDGSYRLAIDADAPLVRADAAQLERALFNVIENGHRHSGGRPVTIRGRQVQDRLVLRVVDTGPGIPEPELSRIFEPFHRGAGADGHGGSGLGLAIARGFVEANGGRLWAESLPGQGTSFVFELPLEPQTAGAAA